MTLKIIFIEADGAPSHYPVCARQGDDLIWDKPSSIIYVPF